MKRRLPNLRDYKLAIQIMPHGLTIKRDLMMVHKELTKTLRESKKSNANADYYKHKIDSLFGILRRTL